MSLRRPGPVAYYNDNDPEMAAWLRGLIRCGLIAPGDVDERDIRDVVPTELARYRQCHFFAGIGVWSHALRRAGWPDDRPVWTGSCPCQPFSAAGRGKGFADERHLWPAWFHLIGQCKPGVILGEQVDGGDGLAWLDLVHDDLEAEGYAVGPVVLPAAGVGAPDGRHRIWFVADANRERFDGWWRGGSLSRPEEAERLEGCLPVGHLADSQRDGGGGRGHGAFGGASGRVQGADGQRERIRPDARSGNTIMAGDLADSRQSRLAGRPGERQDDDPELSAAQRAGGPTNGFWADAEWLPCRDGKARPVEPGTFPLAHGAPARVGRLRGYGNGLCAPAAEAVIRAYLDLNSN